MFKPGNIVKHKRYYMGYYLILGVNSWGMYRAQLLSWIKWRNLDFPSWVRQEDNRWFAPEAIVKVK